VSKAEQAARPVLEGSPVAVLAGAFLFNLGQGVLRPTMPLYLQHIFAANYQMVTLIPVAFGLGKWTASLPTGYLLDRLGRRRLMAGGLILIALADLGSAMTAAYGVFLSLRALGGVGWAAFSTAATTTMVDQAARRGRAVSRLLMSETSGLLLGSTAGGWLYQGVSVVSPFVFEATCMLVAVAAFAIEPTSASTALPRSAATVVRLDWRLLRAVLRIPGVLLMSLCNAVLIGIQTGVLVFLFPLYLVEQGGLRPEMVGLFVSLSVLGRLLGLWLAGNASDRWGRERVLVPGLLAYATLLGSLPLVTHLVALGLWSLTIGVAAGSVAGLPTVLVGDRVVPPLQGVAIGWLRTMTDTGHVLGPTIMGMLADAMQLTTPFLFAAVLLVGVAWQCRRRHLPSTASSS
jgi:DHA1 family multidrug resistance protein-like MFS transporter